MSLFGSSFLDLDDLEDLFEDGFTVKSQSDTQWVFDFTSGDAAGFSVTFGGTGLTGATFPLAGTVQSITVTSATGATANFSGFSIPAPLLASELDLLEDEDEGEDDEDGDEDDDDEGDDDEDEDDDDEDEGEEDEDEENEHLFGGDDDDDIDGGDGDDDVDAGDGDDDVDGGRGHDLLAGEDGNDDVDGDGGDDELSGGRGKDVLTGGLGQDDQDGGLGADCFDFNALKESVVGANHDVVTFARSQGDEIDLSTIDADTDGGRGNQAFDWIGSKGFSGVDGQLRFDDGLLQGDVNGDGRADFEIQIKGGLRFDDIIC